VLSETSRGPQGRCQARRRGRGAPKRCADGEAAQRHQAAAFNGGGVAPVVIDKCGGVLQLQGDPGVRRQRPIEEWSSSEGADGGDARTESGAEEGLRWWKTGEVDAWAMGSVCGARRGRTRQTTCGGRKKVGRWLLLRGATERGGRVGVAWRRSRGERERGA
jgi:hypothetical protein